MYFCFGPPYLIYMVSVYLNNSRKYLKFVTHPCHQNHNMKQYLFLAAQTNNRMNQPSRRAFPLIPLFSLILRCTS